jgi:tetratricopeptide (TPR) repeat protein
MEPLGYQRLDAERADRMFVGRRLELAQLAECAEQAHRSGAVTVSITGEPGIGKTALINRFLSGLDDFTQLRASGDPSEQDMPFGLLGQLLVRVPKGRLTRYPLTLRLATAWEEHTVSALPNVAVQMRCLLDELLDSGPVVLTMDDLQWADWLSIQALRVALWQRHSDPLLVLAAAVTGPVDPAMPHRLWERLLHDAGDLVVIQLPGLDLADVFALAEAQGAGLWSRRAVEDLHTRTEGHPLYVQSVLADAESSSSGHVPGSLVAAMCSRLVQLDPESRRLVDALAVLDGFVPLAAAAAAAGLSDACGALDRVLRLGLVQRRGDSPPLIGIGHELQRHAVYSALTPIRRHELHLAAVPLVEEEAKWAHRVAAAQGWDTAGLAAELEQAAADQVSAGATDRAATWLLWAADLSSDREQRERRLLTAVVQLLAGRRMDRAQPLLENVRSCSPSSLRDCVLGMAAGYHGAYETARELLTSAMGQTQDGAGQWVAMEACNVLALLSIWHGRGDYAMDLAERVLSGPGGQSHLTDLARSSLFIGRLLTQGPLSALRQTEAEWVSEQPATGGCAFPAGSYWHACVSLGRICTGSPTDAAQDARRALDTSYADQAEAYGGDLAYFCLALSQYTRGEWDEAVTNADHAISIAEGLEHPWACARAHAGAAFLAAGRGLWKRASQHIASAEWWVNEVGPPQFVVYPAMAKTVLAQATGDYPGMAAAVGPLLSWSEAGGWIEAYRCWWLPLAVEALTGEGRLDEAEATLRQVQALVADYPQLALQAAWLSGRLSEARGDAHAAASAYRTGLAMPAGEDDSPQQRGRLEESYAELLALTGREAEAIAHLRRAYGRYTRLGAEPFMARCRERLVTLIRLGEPEGGP